MALVTFGSFEFDRGNGRLTKFGHRIKLQPKAAAALGLLLEHPGKIVSRSELQTALWPDGTHVNFDLGIKGSIKKLRDALGDSAEEPVYIQSVYGEGYRFLMAVKEVSEREAGGRAEAMPAEAQPQEAVEPRRKAFWLVAAVAAVVVLCASFLPIVPHGAPLGFRDRDWVVIAGFENRTGDKLLDGSMEFALERELSQSTYLNVVPPDRVADALTLMRQDPKTKLTVDLARQVAVRDGGIKAVLAGRIEKPGGKYLMTMRVLDPASGATVAAFTRTAALGDLPGMARSFSDDIRRKLGESSSQVKDSPVLEKATTPSLAALRAFSAGMEEVNDRHPLRASALLEEAIRDDPNFALAHIYAAHCYSNMLQEEKAAPHYDAAFRLAPGVRERERLFILGGYYAHRANDDRSALAQYEALVKLYPDDYWGVNNLANLANKLGMRTESLNAGERLLGLRPGMPDLGRMTWLFRLCFYYRFTAPDRGKAQKYREELRRLCSQKELSFGEGGSRSNAEAARAHGKLWLEEEAVLDRWRAGDVKGAAEQLASVDARALAGEATDEYRFGLTETNLVLGKLKAARQLCADVVHPIVRAECLLRVDYAGEDRGDARQQLARITANGPIVANAVGDYESALWLGETATAKRWLAQDYPAPAIIRSYWQGLPLLLDGHVQQAVEDLRKKLGKAPDEGSAWPHLWLKLALAMALEREGKIDEAIIQLAADSQPSAVSIMQGYPWPQCRAKLAELYRKAGRSGEATQAENEIRQYLSEADLDYPILQRLSAKNHD